MLPTSPWLPLQAAERLNSGEKFRKQTTTSEMLRKKTYIESGQWGNSYRYAKKKLCCLKKSAPLYFSHFFFFFFGNGVHDTQGNSLLSANAKSRDHIRKKVSAFTKITTNYIKTTINNLFVFCFFFVQHRSYLCREAVPAPHTGWQQKK